MSEKTWHDEVTRLRKRITERDAMIMALLDDFWSFYELNAADETQFFEIEEVRAAIVATGWKRKAARND